MANCDDVLMTSAAYDSPNVVWVAAGGGWANDSVSCPRSGEIIVRATDYRTGHSHGAPDFKRPTPQWWYDDTHVYGPDGLSLPMTLALPGTVNRGNATQAVAAAVALGADPAAAVAAVSAVDEVAGRYRTVQLGAHTARVLLAKNPAGWQEALSMVDKHGAGVVIAVNGQVPDGEDLSWLWDVRLRALRRRHGRRRGRRTRHGPGGAPGLCGRRPHAGARHREGHRILPARARRGDRQLHRVPAVEPGSAAAVS